ncbi:MAG: hypothetical protein AAF633_11470 [Chloroflexota bacterium]
MSVRTPLFQKGAYSGLILLLFFYQIYNLNSFSFGMDEVNSYVNSLTPELLFEGLRQSGGNRVLFYLVLNRWLLLGDQIFWQRVLSSVTIMAAFPFVYMIGRLISSHQTGMLALVLLGFNRFFLSFTRFSRNYSLAILISAAGFWILISALKQSAPWKWILYSILSGLLVMTHPIGVFVLASQAALVFFYPRPIPWRNLIGSGIFSIVVYFLLTFFFQAASTTQLEWIQLPDLEHLFVTITILMGGSVLLLLVYIICYLVGLVLLLPNYFSRFDASREWPFLMIVSWMVIPFILMGITTYIYQPILEPRYLYLSLPAIALVTARVMVSLPVQWLKMSLLTVLLSLTFLGSTSSILNPSQEKWEEATAWVLTHGDGNDAVIFFDYHGQRVFRFYQDLLAIGNDTPQIVEIAASPYFPGGGSRPRMYDRDKVAQFSETHPHVWLILFNRGFHGEHSLRVLNQLESDLDVSYIEIESRDYSGIKVVQYRVK